MKPDFLNQILNSATIYLEPFNESHCEDLISILSEDRIWEQEFYGGLYEKPTTLEGYKAFIKNILTKNVHMFAIKKVDTGETIGVTGVKYLKPNSVTCEIGATAIHVDYWGTSVNFEAKAALINVLFNNGYTTITFVASPKNLRSCKAILKLGSQFIGRKRCAPHPNSTLKWRYVNAYELTQKNWESK